MDVANIFNKRVDNGQYGIDSLQKVVVAANRTYDLFDAVYLDDKKLAADDITDVITLGPNVVSSVVEAAKGFNQVDEEITDLSEAEKSVLITLAGDRIHKPAYIKILKGLLDITDGVSELVNAENPEG